MNLDDIRPENNWSKYRAEKKVKDYHETEKKKALREVRRRYRVDPGLPPPAFCSSMDLTDLFLENMSKYRAEKEVKTYYETERLRTLTEVRRRFRSYTDTQPTVLRASGVVAGLSWLVGGADDGGISNHDWTLTVATEDEPNKVVASFKVHRSVLAARSDFFKTLFKATGFSESSTESSKLVLPRDDIPYVPDLLDFCYGRQVQLDPKTATGFYKAVALQNMADRLMADRLMARELVKPIERFWQRLGYDNFKIKYDALRRFEGGDLPYRLIYSVSIWLANTEDRDEARAKLSILPHRIQTEIVYFLVPLNRAFP